MTNFTKPTSPFGTNSYFAQLAIHNGKDPETMHHLLADGDSWSSGISRDDYLKGGYTSSYKSLAEIAQGCWD